MGRLPSKKPQGPAKWVHSDNAGITEQQWRGSFELVNVSHSSATHTTMEIETTGGSGEMSAALTREANAMSSIHSDSLINKEEPNSPLTIDCDYFSDIENGNGDKTYKIFVMVARNDDEILGEEENDDEGLEEEVVSGLLGLTDIHHT
jgi:hypothetical protein